MKKIGKTRIIYLLNTYIITLCFTCLISSFKAQDTTDTKNRYFYVNIGINNTIPKKGNYHILSVNNNPDGQTFNYSVSPQYSFMGGGLSFGFQYPVIKIKKIKISLGSEIGINLYQNRSIIVGTRNGGISGNTFKGGIYTTNNFYNGSLNIVTSLSYPLNNTLDFIFYLGSGVNYNFLTTIKTTEEDIILNKTNKYKYTETNGLNDNDVNSFFKILILKKIKTKEYGIFVGTTFFGNYFSSSSPNSYKEERDLNAMGRYFILNYGLSYQF